MNVAASSGTADITGYVIPIARVLRVEQQVLSGAEAGTIHVGYDGFLGVELAADVSAPVVAGLVDGGPAADAGIPSGATITSVDGRSVTTADQLRSLLADLDASDTVTVTWTTSGGSTGSAQVTLGRAPVA
jgi:S1-C subfamily serine protease